MAAIDENRPLIEVVPVCVGQRRALPQPPQQCRRGVEDEGREDEGRKPPRPDAAGNAFQPEQTREKAEPDRPDIAHEQPRRRSVENQKAGAGGGQGTEEHAGIGAAGQGGGDGVGAETEQAHASRQAVRPIHEIVQIGHPDHGQHRKGQKQPTRVGENRGRQDSRGCVGKQADRRRQRAEIVDQRHGHHQPERYRPQP